MRLKGQKMANKVSKIRIKELNSSINRLETYIQRTKQMKNNLLHEHSHDSGSNDDSGENVDDELMDDENSTYNLQQQQQQHEIQSNQVAELLERNKDLLSVIERTRNDLAVSHSRNRIIQSKLDELTNVYQQTKK